MRRLIAIVIMLFLSTATAFALGTEDECLREVHQIISNQQLPLDYEKLPHATFGSARGIMNSWTVFSGPKYIVAITEDFVMEVTKLRSGEKIPLKRKVTIYRIYFTPKPSS